jgi:hypothetical protein
VRQALLAMLLLPSCNALFGIEEGRPYPADASSAGSSGRAGTAGSAGAAGGGGEAGGAGDASADAAEASVDAGSDARDASAVVCPLITDCGPARQCWCEKCRGEIEKCISDPMCREALECLLHSDCGMDFISCQGTIATTCPTYCANIGANVSATLGLLQPLANCANINTQCENCANYRSCQGPCPVIMPRQNEPVPSGCPPGGPICNYESRRCQCLSDKWTCT